MSQQSDERALESAPPTPEPARILPFERPLSDLQRAIQWRAQAANDRDREVDREIKKPKPLKWLIIFLLAMVPVVLIFGALDAFLRIYYKMTDMYLSPSAETQPAPPQPEALVSPPGTVLLLPYETETMPSDSDHPNADQADAAADQPGIEPAGDGAPPPQR
jgi:hypothetical protein